MITSTSNPKIKQVALLRDKARARREEGAYVVEGLRMFREIPAGDVREVYVTQDFYNKNESLCSTYKDLQVVSDKVFEKIADTVTPQGVVAVVSMKETSLEDVLKGDFLLFLDFDEFVKIESNIDINTYVYNKKFNKCETIVLNWVMYGDNNLVKYDNRTMIERFTKPIGNWTRGKSIVRTNIPKLIISSTFMIGINTQYFCDSNGNRLFPSSYYGFEVPNNPEAYIKHFYTKTAEEFCN